MKATFVRCFLITCMLCICTMILNYCDPILTIYSDAVRYAFGPLVQKELDQLAREWNYHRIRRSNMAEVPNGIPELLYNLPSVQGKSVSEKLIHLSISIILIIIIIL